MAVLYHRPLHVVNMRVVRVFPTSFLHTINVHVIVRGHRAQLYRGASAQHGRLVFVQVAFRHNGYLVFPHSRRVPFLIFRGHNYKATHS